jgi:hypothetical protein
MNFSLQDVSNTIIKEARRISTYAFMNHVDNVVYIAKDLGDVDKLLKYLVSTVAYNVYICECLCS